MALLYRTFTFFLFPIFLLLIVLRIFFNKEDKKRFKEKIWLSEKYFPKGKETFWFHAASIGETNSVLPLIKELIKQNNNIFVLLTTTTLSSSQLIKKKKFNKDRFQHRFFPLDVLFLVKNFLNKWKPKKIIFVDSEIWPNYLLEISRRKIPLALINARITVKTLKRWKMFSKFSKKLFNLYDLCLSSSKETEENLKSLGAKNIKYFGNLKFCVPPQLNFKTKNLQSIFNDNYIWCAASTHKGEENIIFNTHINLKNKGLKVVTILIPRHISRSQEIYSICKDLDLNGKIIDSFDEISKENEIYIVNAIGEMANYFLNCKSVFMGKSLSKKLIKVGGQNPIEPAKYGCKIYHGPFVSNFKEIYELLNNKKITHQIYDEKELADNLFKDFTTKNQTLNQNNVKDLDRYGKEILDKTLREVLKF